MEEKLVEELIAARQLAADAARPGAVAAVHERGRLTARERLDRLFDQGSFVEYGVLAQTRATASDTPAAGLVGGTGRVDGQPVVAASYDFTVENGAQ